MASRRMIASDIFEDEFVGNLSYFERLLWIGMITSVADDQGRLMDNPALIRAKVFLFDNVTDKEVEAALHKLNVANKIVRYVDGTKKLIQIIKWWKYQSPSWANPSKHIAPKGWIDRAKYHAQGNKILTFNWDKDGGYVDDYVAGYVPKLDSAIDKKREEENRQEENRQDEEEESESVEPFRVLFDAFLDASGISELMIVGSRAVDEINNKWIPSGVTPDEVKGAVKALQDKSYNITGPWSITNSINMVRSKKKGTAAKPGSAYKLPDDWNDYEMDDKDDVKPEGDAKWRMFIDEYVKNRRWQNLLEYGGYDGSGKVVIHVPEASMAEAKSRFGSTLSRYYLGNFVLESVAI